MCKSKESVRRIVAPILNVFVLISIGFAFGRLTRPQPSTEKLPQKESTEEIKESIVVTYLHGTMRCVSCNTIEQTLRTVLDEFYSEQMQAKELVFREVNFDRDEMLAKRWDINSSMAVISREREGQEQEFVVLHDVWTYVGDNEALSSYLKEQLDQQMQEKGQLIEEVQP